MKKLLIIFGILILLIVLTITSSSIAVWAVAGVDNMQAYQDALSAISRTTIGAITEGWTGTANTLEKGLSQIVKLFEKAIE